VLGHLIALKFETGSKKATVRSITNSPGAGGLLKYPLATSTNIVDLITLNVTDKSSKRNEETEFHDLVKKYKLAQLQIRRPILYIIENEASVYPGIIFYSNVKSR
jgi:hypothetical protein